MAIPIELPFFQFFSASNRPLSGGKLYSYLAGTTTPTALYTSQGGGTSHQWPVTLGTDGTAEIWMDPEVSYDFVLKTATGATLKTWSGINKELFSSDLSDDTDPANGAALVGYRGRTVADRLDDTAHAKDYGVVGDGIADDTSALQSLFNSGKRIYLGSGLFLVSGELDLPHPFYIVGDGPEKTIFKFTERGGFSGKNGITITVAETEKFLSLSYAADFTMEVHGEHGKHAIETPTTLTSHPSNLWAQVRPQFVFERVFMRGGTLTSLASPRSDYGWARYWSIGDSALATFRGCFISGCFDDSLDPTVSPSLETKETIGWYFGGLDDANGGAVYMPLIDQCSTGCVGKNVVFGRRVSNPRVTSSQFGRGGYGIYSDRIWLGTSDLGISELQAVALNINACFGGIVIADTDFLTASDINCTRASTTYNHSSTWYGFYISNAARRVALDGCRGFYSNVNYTNTRYAASFFNVEILTVDDFFIRHDGPGAFAAGIATFECDQVAYNGINSVGNVTTLISISGDPGYSPKIQMDGLSGDSSLVALVTYDGDTRRKNISTPTSWRIQGTDDTSEAISSAGTTSINVNVSNQFRRFEFSAGSGPYTRNIKLLDDNVSDGDTQKIWLQVNSTAGTNPTINILNEAGATLLQILGDSSTKKYALDLVYNGTTWVISSAVQSLA